MNVIAKLALWVWFCLILVSPAAAQSYKITDLGVLRGETSSAGIGINSSGQVVGCSDTSTSYYPCSGSDPGRAFLWNSKTGMKNLGTLHGDEIGGGVGINDSGEVVGYTENAQGVFRAFLWTKKTGMIGLRTLPGGTSNFAAAINAGDLIVGSSDFRNSKGHQHAVYWTADRKIHDLGSFHGAKFTQGVGINSHNEICGQAGGTGFTWTKAGGMKALRALIKGGGTVVFAMNNAGMVVGNADTATASYPVLWNSKGRIRELGTLPGGSGTAFGVNNLDQIVGFSRTESMDAHAFIWSSKSGIQDLNDLIASNSGWVLVWASAINDAGQITGWGTINGENHAYLLTP